ncbi:hypothetical protein C0J52_21310 [Blattella germanica]|nr:hypothetical protein C0J52_21310 [Blattella germanica]
MEASPTRWSFQFQYQIKKDDCDVCNIFSHFDREALLYLCMHVAIADPPPFSTSTINRRTSTHRIILSLTICII